MPYLITHQDRWPLIVAMKKWGGDFASNLANAWLYADEENSLLLYATFRDLLHSYEKFVETDDETQPKEQS